MRYLRRLQSIDTLGRRDTTMSVGHAVGRGRSVMLIVTVLLGLLGYISPSIPVANENVQLNLPDTSVSGHVTQTRLNAVPPNQAVPSQAVPSQAVPSQAVPSQVVPPQVVPYVWPVGKMSDIVARHGGALADERVSHVRAIGKRLVAAAATPLNLRFDVLADLSEADVYVLNSGNVLFTAGLVDRLQNHQELAAAIARQLEALVRSRGTTPADSADGLMLAAGYRVEALAEFDRQLAQWRTYGTGREVLANHVERSRRDVGLQ